MRKFYEMLMIIMTDTASQPQRSLPDNVHYLYENSYALTEEDREHSAVIL